MDYVFAPEEIDEKIRGLIAEGKLVSKKGRKDEELPPEFQWIKNLFEEAHVEAWLEGRDLDSNDPLTAKIIAGKAPLALKLANRIIDAGYALPLKEGLKEEMAPLNEIFSQVLIALFDRGKRSFVQFALFVVKAICFRVHLIVGLKA